MGTGAPDDRSATWAHDEAALLAVARDTLRPGGDDCSIDGYDVLAEVSRGGQGVVFLARHRAMRRTVAIKVLLDRSLAQPDARRRFEREAEIVATLDHPGIVRVFDAGVTGDGRPYLVMEFVEGVSLDRAAEGLGRDPRRVSLLVAAVCDALHAAHLHGVIHRDVKPTNVLVDASGAPRLLDFGLARSVAAIARDRTAASEPGRFLGSLPWATPEQASGDPARVDVRSDVYGAGVVLFHALTGAFPYPVDGSFASTLHAIEREEPRRPSDLRRDVPKELDAIVRTALAKDPAQRYQSAAEFAADLRAFAAGEPIRAQRESAAAAMARVVRRSRRALAVGTVVAIVLAAVAGTALWQASVARAERARAERRFAQVREIASDTLFGLYAEIQPLDGSRRAREVLVTSMLGYLRDLAPDAGDDPAFMAELASAWERVGDIQGHPALPSLGQVDAALASYREAIALRTRVAEARPDAAAFVALAATESALGFAQHFGGDPAGAVESFGRAQAALTKAAAIDPHAERLVAVQVACLDRLSDALAQVGAIDEAKAALDRALAQAESLPATAADPVAADRVRGVLFGKMAATLRDAGRGAEALPYAEGAVARQRAVLARITNDEERRGLAIELNTLSGILESSGRVADAAAAASESVAISRAILARDPADVLARRGLAFSLIRLGQAKAAMGDESAVADLEAALALRAELRAQAPTNAAARRAEAVAAVLLAEVRAALAGRAERPEAALAHRREAARLFRVAADAFDAMRTDGSLGPEDAPRAGEWRARAASLDG